MHCSLDYDDQLWFFEDGKATINFEPHSISTTDEWTAKDFEEILTRAEKCAQNISTSSQTNKISLSHTIGNKIIKTIAQTKEIADAQANLLKFLMENNIDININTPYYTYSNWRDISWPRITNNIMLALCYKNFSVAQQLLEKYERPQFNCYALQNWIKHRASYQCQQYDIEFLLENKISIPEEFESFEVIKNARENIKMREGIKCLETELYRKGKYLPVDIQNIISDFLKPKIYDFQTCAKLEAEERRIARELEDTEENPCQRDWTCAFCCVIS